MAPQEKRSLSRQDIEGFLLHRRPFLFLESAEIIEPGIKASGELADRTHEDFAFLKGHFPPFNIFPGALIMEALAELSGVAYQSGVSRTTEKVGVLIEDKMRYKGMIKPEDRVRLEAEILFIKMGIGKSKVKATKDNTTVAEGEITFALVDKAKLFDDKIS